MNNKLSILFPELTVEQLDELSDWLSYQAEKTLADRVYGAIERKRNVTLKVINNSLRIDNPVQVITEIRKLLANGKIERYSLSGFKTAYRVKK